ncbi:hypothetical protein B0H17DRAFT_227429 [Mycena rosella]|uniref:Uncharacterized protein n=1 Tax=Mycena rosella TaxID=1033263 RepID=A0AAD7MBK1_MYCRO|nr:hypothetical protein B0H17DRAFT_227429 [Mycena rosella]
MVGSEDSAEILNKFLTEYKKREAKKVSARSAAFQTQKKALYAASRKAAKDLARDGTACLEEGKAKLLALKAEEVSADKFSEQVVPLWKDVEGAANGLLSLYPTDLFQRRSDAINAASEMLSLNPSVRSDALATCVDNANSQLYKSKMDEMAAADASRLIKYYKSLLLT